MSEQFRWLHVADPCCPVGDDAEWRAAFRQSKEDLRRALASAQAAQTFHAILVTGNVTCDGSAGAYARAGDFLDDLAASFGARGCAVLATPGPLDGDGFGPWWSGRLDGLPPNVEVRGGKRPGDYSATVNVEKTAGRVGFVSVDTAGGDRGPGELAAMCGKSLWAWRRAHNAAALMTWKLRAVDPRDAFVANQITEGDLPFDQFDVVHVSSGAAALQPANVLRPWSFLGHSNMRGLLGTSHGVATGRVEFDHGQSPVVVVSEVDMSGWGPIRARVQAKGNWLESGGPVPGPLPRRRAPRPPRELNDRDVVGLVWDVLPDNTLFRGFLYEELRERRRLAPDEAGRERQTELLVERLGRQEVMAALKRYLPDALERELVKLGHGTQDALEASVPSAKAELRPEERDALAALRELAEARADGCAEHSDVLARVARALEDLAAGDPRGATLTMLDYARSVAQRKA